jgi:hypothetical protein
VWSNNILSEEELEALLTPEELEVLKAEPQDQLEHELILSPTRLLLAIRELEAVVLRLSARVEQLEQQQMLPSRSLILIEKPALPEPAAITEDGLFELKVEAAADGYKQQEDSLISRADRHRARKTSILSKLLK